MDDFDLNKEQYVRDLLMTTIQWLVSVGGLFVAKYYVPLLSCFFIATVNSSDMKLLLVLLFLPLCGAFAMPIIKILRQGFPVHECATASVMSGLGDILAQAQKTTEKYDYRRTLVFVLKGYGDGALWSLWYRRADSIVAAVANTCFAGMPVYPFLEVVLMTLLSLFFDLIIASPIIYSIWDIPFPAVARGKTKLRQVPVLVQKKLPEMLVASLKIWTPVNVLIYNIPAKYRVVTMSVADVFWQSIVSAITFN